MSSRQIVTLIRGLRRNYRFFFSLLSLRTPRLAVLTFVFAATIAYDSRIKSFNSGAGRTDNGSSSTHFVATYVRCWANSLVFREFGKLFWSAFERKPLRDGTQVQHGEDLASDFETEIFSPLQVLLGVGEAKTEVTDGFYVHE